MCDIEFHHSSSELYGSDRSLLGLVEELQGRGVAVSVNLPDDGPLRTKLESLGVEVECNDVIALRRSVLTGRGLIRLAQALAKYGLSNRPAHAGKPSVVISNTSVVLSGYLRAWTSRARHVVFVREWYKSRLERRLFSLLLHRADRIICVSESVRSQFCAWKSLARKCVVVHSGADIGSYRVGPAPSADGREGLLRVLCPGRINSWKGQDVLIDALADLSGRGIRFDTRIVGGEYGGGTELTRALKRRASRNSLEVEFVGEVQTLRSMYEWCDIVVVPSTSPEPFGKVVVEALAAGRVVIASNIAGPSEIINDMKNGLLFQVGDSRSLADRLHIAWADDALRTAISTAAAYRAELFDQTVLSREAVDCILR